MKENLTTFEDALLKEGTPHLFIEFVRNYEDELSLEFRLTAPDFLNCSSQDAEISKILQKMQAQKELLLEEITDQAISERTKRACVRANIRKIKDLCSQTRDEVRSCGREVMLELEDFLNDINLSFKDPDSYESYFSIQDLLKKHPNAVTMDIEVIRCYIPDSMMHFMRLAEVNSIKELCTKSEQDILRYNSCGPMTVVDIIAFLRKLGLSLKTEGEWVIPKRQDPASSKEIADILSRKISDFNVPVRVQRVCEFGDIKTIGDLVTHSSMDLLKLPGCGKKTITDIKNLLESLNMELRQGYLKKVS